MRKLCLYSSFVTPDDLITLGVTDEELITIASINTWERLWLMLGIFKSLTQIMKNKHPLTDWHKRETIGPFHSGYDYLISPKRGLEITIINYTTSIDDYSDD